MRYFIGLIITAGLLIALIVLLMTGGSKPKEVHQKLLTDYASTDAQAIMTIDGPVNAESLHEQVRITVDSTNVTYEHIKGYQGDVVSTKVFANNQDAYDVFLHALLHAGYALGDKNSALRDERGYCATGDRFIFELKQGGDILQRYWSSSCNGTHTYLGNTELTTTLFEAQIPGYTDLTADVDL